MQPITLTRVCESTEVCPQSVTRDARTRRAILACVVPAMCIPFLASCVYFWWMGAHPAARAAYGLTKVFTVVWPFVAVLAIERRPDALKPDRRTWLRSIPLGLLTGAVIGGAILAAYRLPALNDYASGFAEDIRSKLADLGVVSRWHYVAFCAFLAIAHSLIEEFYWRWYVFGSLARVWPVGLSVFLASLAFAGHHYVVLGCYFSATGSFAFGTAVGIGGAIWCWMYRRQRTIVGTWVSHAMVDAAIFIVGYDILFGG